MKSKWITHKGKRIRFSDLSDFGTDIQALKAETDADVAVICQQPEGSILGLIDVRNTVASAEAVQLLKQGNLQAKPYIRKQAVIGATGIRRILAKAVARFSGLETEYFDDIESAKDWLVAG